MRTSFFMFLFGMITNILLSGCAMKSDYPLQISSTPSNAYISTTNEKASLNIGNHFTPATVYVVAPFLPGEPEENCFTLSKKGYLSETKCFRPLNKQPELRIDDKDTKYWHVNLKPIPQTTLTESINSIPSGAKIYTGESRNTLRYIGITPYLKKYTGEKEKVKINHIIYKLEKEGYQAEYYTIYDKNKIINAELTKKPTYTIIEVITSQPSNAKIYMGTSKDNIKFTGYTTPHKFRYSSYKKFIDSKYCQLRKKGYKNTPIKFLNQTDKDREINFKLNKLDFGVVKLMANQKNVNIYIDGEYAGKISGRPFVTKLFEGTHVISAKKEFFGTKSIKINMDAFETYAYKFELQKGGNTNEQMAHGKISQSTGTLVLFTDRNDVKVSIDGIVYQAPFTINGFASGQYKARITTPTKTKTITITVKENEKTLILLDEYLE